MFLLQVIFFIIIGHGAGLTKDHTKEIEENVFSFQKQVQSPQSLKSYGTLFKTMEQTFSAFPEASLKVYCQGKTYALWPSQETWRQVLIGEIFYPRQEIEDIYEGYGGRQRNGKWMLTTRPVMERLAISARAGNTIATLYLGHACDQTCYVHQDNCPIALKLYEKASQVFQETVSTEGHPYQNKAKYFLASRFFKLYDYSTALRYLENLFDREAHFLEFIIKLKDENCTDKPSLENFLELGYSTQYPAAFLYALGWFNLDYDKENQILEKASQTVPHPALYLEWGSHYQYRFKNSGNISFKEKALPLLEKAASLRSPIAYREMIEYFAPYKIVDSRFDFSETKGEDLPKYREYLEKAATLGLPSAFFNLAVWESESAQRQQKDRPLPEADVEKIHDRMVNLVKQAAQAGFWGAYAALEE